MTACTVEVEAEFYTHEGLSTGDRFAIRLPGIPRIGEMVRIGQLGLYTVGSVEWFTSLDRDVESARPRLWLYPATPRETEARK